MDDRPQHAAAFPSSSTASAGSVSKNADKENRPRPRKGGLSNMRKSFAWNTAFFTEEGVLNPVELSMLSAQAAKLNQNFLLGDDKEGVSASSFTGTVLRDDKCKLQGTIDADVGTKSRTRSQNKPRIIRRGFLSDVKSSTKERPPFNVAQKNALEGRAKCKGASHPPTPILQKRIADACITNPSSKVPKLKGDLLPASKNVHKPSKGSKVIQTVPPVNLQESKQGVGLKSATVSTEKGSNSNKSSFAGLRKNVTQQDSSLIISQNKVTDHSSVFPSHPKPPVPTKMTPSSDMASSRKLQTSSSEIEARTIQATTMCLNKPSALRKPSPTLGFFVQGKSSSSIVDDLVKPQSLDGKLPVVSSTVERNTNSCLEKFNMSGNSITSNIALDMNPAVHSNTESSLSSASKSPVNSILNSPVKPGTESSSKSEVKSTNESGSFERIIVLKSSAQQKYKRQVEDGKAWAIDDSFDGLRGNLAFDLPKPIASLAHPNLMKTTTSLGSDVSEVELHASLETGTPSQASNDSNISSCAENSESDCNVAVDVIHGSSVLNEPECRLTPKADIEVFPKNDGYCLTSRDFKETNHVKSMNDELLGESDCEKIGSIPNKVIFDVSLPTADTSNEMLTSNNNDIPYCQKPFEYKNDGFSSDDEESASLVNKQSLDISKENQVPFQGTLKAKPFTDEWIAALEAFGDDILKMKSGAVQNSPTDKVPSEPSPWSPVKPKNQEVGPYDCTKYTKKPSSQEPV